MFFSTKDSGWSHLRVTLYGYANLLIGLAAGAYLAW